MDGSRSRWDAPAKRLLAGRTVTESQCRGRCQKGTLRHFGRMCGIHNYRSRQVPKVEPVETPFDMKAEQNPLDNAELLKAELTDPTQWQQQPTEKTGYETSARLLAELERAYIDPTEDIPPPEIALSIGSTPYNRSTIGTMGNLSMIIGKAKSKKTFFVSIALAAASSSADVLGKFRGHLPTDRRTVLFFDTEQGRQDVQTVVKRICRMMGKDAPTNFKAYGLRKYSPAERVELIRTAIANEPNLGFVVIDGARDLVTSINDEEQATALSSHFLKWTEEKQFHLMTVLHQNKGDNNARGHLGTELVNKAQTVLSVTKDEASGFSIVESEFSRYKDPEPFAFDIDGDGLPRLVEHWELTAEKYQTQKGVTPLEIPHETHLAILEEVFQKLPQPKYAELWRQLKTSLGTLGKKIGDNRAKEFAQWYAAENYIIREGLDNSPKAFYQFNREKTDSPLG